MNTTVSTLSIGEALKSSLPFAIEFFKRHWIVVSACALVIILSHIIIAGEKNVTDVFFRPQFLLLYIAGIIPGLLLIYYAIRTSLLQLEPSQPVADKSLSKILGQIFGLHIFSWIISMPLFMLFFLPAIWWWTKASAACSILISTNNGPIESIELSHRLVNNRFWPCFGYLFAVITIVNIGVYVITSILALLISLVASVFGGAMLGGLLGKIIISLASVLTTIMLYYCQVRLYVFLQSQKSSLIT